MMFLLLGLPLGVLGAYLGFLTWRVGHWKITLGMMIFSVICLLIGTVPIVFAWLCTQAGAVQF